MNAQQVERIQMQTIDRLERETDTLHSELRRWKMFTWASFIIGVLIGATVL